MEAELPVASCVSAPCLPAVEVRQARQTFTRRCQQSSPQHSRVACVRDWVPSRPLAGSTARGRVEVLRCGCC